MESNQTPSPVGPPPLSTTTMPITPPVVTGPVVNQTTAATADQTTPAKKISSGAVSAISAGIGVGNVCCGPICNTCPTFVSSAIGIILYFVWKDRDPQAAKTILMVTVITGGVALVIFGILFAFGLAGALIDSLQSY